jgi:signal transduction histidine kinase
VDVLPHVRQVSFVIEDTGIGMSQNFIENGLFEPFEQEERQILGDRRGIGIGMALANILIKKMNGTIEVKSEKGRGTISIVTLKLSLEGDVFFSLLVTSSLFNT